MRLKMGLGNQRIKELTLSHYISTSSLCTECLANIEEFFSKDNGVVQGGKISPLPASHPVLKANKFRLLTSSSHRQYQA